METAAVVFGGVVVSLIVEVIKNKFGTNTPKTMGIVIGLSLIGAVAYQLLGHYGLWDAFVGVLTTAGAFYAFVIKNLSS